MQIKIGEIKAIIKLNIFEALLMKLEMYKYNRKKNTEFKLKKYEGMRYRV